MCYVVCTGRLTLLERGEVKLSAPTIHAMELGTTGKSSRKTGLRRQRMFGTKSSLMGPRAILVLYHHRELTYTFLI